MSLHHVRYHAGIALLLACGLSGAAAGQNALGDGRGLEQSLQSWSGPRISQMPRSFTNELAFRESILAGTAPDGLSFRGRALPSRYEFRGELGEDALFAFRRDSLYSGLAGKGIRGTEALQYQAALTIGSQVPSSLAGQLSFARAGAAERGSDPVDPLGRDISGQDSGLRRVDPTEFDENLVMSAIESGTSMLYPVRSTSSYRADQGLRPTLVGLMQNKVTHQTSGQTSSPLLGLQVVPVDVLRNPLEGVMPETRAPAPRVQPGEVGEVGGAPETPELPAYAQLIDRFKATYDMEANPTPEGELPVWAKDLMSVQRALRGLPAPVVQPRAVTEETAETPDVPAGPGRPTDLSALEIERMRPEVLERFREVGGKTDSLIATNLPRIDRYAAYMQTGQDMLATQRYFDAEEVFITALTDRPGDVNASVGRAHSQIGAGLFLSAALNVRSLLVRSPEISGMRYGASLLPSPERMAQVSASLRSSLGSVNTGADSGLLLAYLGFQRGIEADIRDGLDALGAHGDEADRRLVEMLRAVWLGEGVPGAVESPSDDG